MKNHLQFRLDYLPVDYSKAEKMVVSFSLMQNKGFFYPCGRDKNFRPILVFNAKMIDFNDVEVGIMATCFVHEEIIKNMFLPGQI
jgi:hypothetical protein